MASSQGSSGSGEPESLRSDVGDSQESSMTRVLEELRKYEYALRDTQVWEELIEKGSPSDLLVFFPYLKTGWVSAVREIRRNQGDRDAMEKLLNLIIQSCAERWPDDLCKGLEDCSQNVLARLFKDKYEEICKRPLYEHDQPRTEPNGGSMHQPVDDGSTLSMAILQHRRLYEQAARNCQKELRRNGHPIHLLRHIPYVQKDRIQAAFNTCGRGEAMDTFLSELMYPQRDHDWPQDLIQALRKENQSVIADLLQLEYSKLREKAFKDGTCKEFKEHLAQQQPTPGRGDSMDTSPPGGPPSGPQS